MYYSGVVEGFYGLPWSTSERRKLIDQYMEFGELNLNCLGNQLKKDVIKLNILLKKNILFKGLVNLLYYVCRRCYKIKFISNDIIKIGMLSAILKGYYKIN